VLTGIGVWPIVEFEQLIDEILVRVGSGDKDASSEEADHQDRADKLWKTGSGGMYGRDAENTVPLSFEMLCMFEQGVWSSNLNISESLSLRVSSMSENVLCMLERGVLSSNSNLSESLSLRVSSLSENVSSLSENVFSSSLMVGKQLNLFDPWLSFVEF